MAVIRAATAVTRLGRRCHSTRVAGCVKVTDESCCPEKGTCTTLHSIAVPHACPHSLWRHPVPDMRRKQGSSWTSTAATVTAATIMAMIPATQIQCDTGNNIDIWDSLVGELSAGADEEINLERYCACLQKRGDKQFIFQTLWGERRIRQMRVWRFTQSDSPIHDSSDDDDIDVISGKTRLVVLFEVGDELNGHAGIVHGGFTSAILDEIFGFTANMEVRDLNFGSGKVQSASLRIHYRSKLKANSVYSIESFVHRISKQKRVYLKANVRDKSGKLVADASSMFVLK